MRPYGEYGKIGSLMKTSTFSIFLFLAVLAGCSAAAPEDKSPVLARFNGAVITEKEFLHKLEGMPPELRRAAMRRKKEILEDMASESFLVKEAEKKGIEKDADVQDLLKAARKKIVVAKLIESEVDEKIALAPGEASQYYEAHKEEFMTPVILRASHILVKTEAEAADIKAQLDAGADFEELARAKSLDATARRGGDLGFFQKGQFVPEFEEKVFSMKKGDVSAPVRSQFGYHIIKLTDQAPPGMREFKTVKRSIEEKLYNEKRSRALKALIGKLKGNAKVEIDEKALEAVGNDVEKE